MHPKVPEGLRRTYAGPGRDGRLVESYRYDWADQGLATLSDDDARYQSVPLSDKDRSGEVGDWARRRERGEDPHGV